MPTKKSTPRKKDGFSKVGKTLYRYNPSGDYYALVKKSGKQIRRSLKTDDQVNGMRFEYPEGVFYQAVQSAQVSRVALSR